MFSTQFPWLTAIILFPLVAALAIPAIRDKEGKTVRFYALGVGLTEFFLTVNTFWNFYNIQDTKFQLVENYPWLPQLGMNWSLGVDGISMPLIILACLVTTLAILASWNIKDRPKLYYSLILVLYSAQIGVLAAKNMFLFFVMWELELLPIYLLLAIWGSKKISRYAATKFILYSSVASVFFLIGALTLGFWGDNFTLEMAELATKHYPVALATLVYAGFLIAFAVKLPIFPFHTWVPDVHEAASAPVAMILTGVLKVGSYGLIRMNMELLPDAHIKFAPVLVILGVVNIIYGAFAAFGQTHLTRKLAYSSISHVGFVLIGIASFTSIGMNGAMLQILSHGIIAAVLFFLAGVAYDRTSTLMTDELGGLAKEMPKTFALFTIGSLASLALPGMSGFVAELTVFLGFSTTDAYSSPFKVVVIFLTAVGLIVTPIYLLSMLRVVFYGKKETNNINKNLYQIDANPREIFITASMLIPIIAIGFYPKLLTHIYDATTVEVAARVHNALPVIAQQKQDTLNANLPATFPSEAVIAPELPIMVR
jgi:NAD(P)H-quinone oxidoreductase subunit 4